MSESCQISGDLMAEVEPRVDNARAVPRLRMLWTAVRVWIAWTGVAVLFTLYVMLPSPAAGDLGEWARAWLWQLVSWWSWAVCTPLVVAVARRFMAMRPARVVAAHLAASVVVSGFCTAVQETLRWMVFSGVRTRYDIEGASSVALADTWSFNVVVYAMAVGVFYSLRTARLESQLARARLNALSARLQPHFLFNTLNTISALVEEDPKAANQMIVRLSALLRQAFDRAETDEVTLDEERRLVEHYVAIQEQRFGARLRVTWQVEPAAERGRLPALLLQPLVENAIAHGLSGPDARGSVHVTIEACRQADRLRLVVADDGPGFGGPETLAGGVGLTGTQARLTERYGTAHTLEFSNAPGGGARVIMEIPFVGDARSDR